MQGRISRYLMTAALLVLPAAAQAQATGSEAPDTTATVALTAPTEAQTTAARPAPAGVQRTNAASAHDIQLDQAESLLLQQRRSMGQPKAMMIVGASAFLAGAIIGGTAGTVLMVGGAIIGLVGLYDYLN